MPQTPQASGATGTAAAVQSVLRRAVEHHQMGRLHEADELYRQILLADARQADALHLRGVIALQRGQYELAVDWMRQAIAVRPADNFCCNLGNALKELGRRDEAIACYRQALALNPNMAEAHSNLGHELLAAGALDEAVASCQRALRLQPALVAAHCNLGNARLQQGRAQDAADCYFAALQIAPGLALAHGNLGHALQALGRLDEAIACYRHALSIGPVTAELLSAMGRACHRQGRLDLAIDSCVQALHHGDTPELRAALVQVLQSAHFQAPQPAVRALLIRALDEAWADPAQLLTPACSLIEAQPATRQAIAWVQAKGHDTASSPAPLPPDLLVALADDALLLAVLRNDCVNSIALERVLRQVRRQLLDQALLTAGVGPRQAGAITVDDPDALHAALAWQCFVNEYVYVCSASEHQQLARLRQLLDEAHAAGTPPVASWLMAWASYAPLSELPGAASWAAMSWPAPLAALFTQQWTEPAQEQRLRVATPRLSAIDDAVSLKVQAQYEQNPYPRWMRLPPSAAPEDLALLLRRQFPAAPLQALRAADEATPLQVLVAGCGTGQHPIRVARQLRHAQVLAVDLSLASLAYAQRKTTEAGLRNITYAQADLLLLGGLTQRFDLIESVGVLHHLANPLAGWRVLLDLLRPGGLMCLGLYSALGRRDVLAARQLLAGHALPTSAAEIRQCRQQLMANAQAPQFQQFLSSRDFYSTSACRDLLFHVQEHRYTLPQLKATLSQLGLNFVGFVLDADRMADYTRQFPEDPARTDLDRWHAFETAQPDTFSRMYQFWVQKPAQAAD